MTIDEFIEICLKDIQQGIESFNNDNPRYQAEMPPGITLELKIAREGKDVRIANDSDSSHLITTLKLSINIQWYRNIEAP